MSVKKYLDRLDDLSNKEVLVTGGTSGIGLKIVDHLLYKRAKVIVLARNEEKAKEVKSNLLIKYPNAQLDFIKYDQSDNESIAHACDEIINNHQGFYALVFNAGMFSTKKDENGTIPLTIKTNFVGLACFLRLLVPRLTGKHRIIIQGSLVAGWRNKKINSLKGNKLSNFQKYIISKSGCESLFGYYQNLGLNNLSFYLIEPGLTATDIIREFHAPIKQMGKVAMKVFPNSTPKAALPALLALQENISSCFIVPRGLFACCGYPKIKSFPKKRNRTNLLQLLEEVI